jgi:hypothetical protein
MTLPLISVSSLDRIVLVFSLFAFLSSSHIIDQVFVRNLHLDDEKTYFRHL